MKGDIEQFQNFVTILFSFIGDLWRNFLIFAAGTLFCILRDNETARRNESFAQEKILPIYGEKFHNRR